MNKLKDNIQIKEDEEMEIDLLDLFQFFKSRFLILLVVLLLGAVLAGIVLMVLALWTDTLYGSQTIDIIQGRYFMPFVIPFLLVINSKCCFIWKESKRKLITAYFFLQIGVVVSVLNQIAL